MNTQNQEQTRANLAAAQERDTAAQSVQAQHDGQAWASQANAQARNAEASKVEAKAAQAKADDNCCRDAKADSTDAKRNC